MHLQRIALLLVLAVCSGGCAPRGDEIREVAGPDEIREITMRSGGMGPNRTVNNYSVTLRRDGTAEMIRETTRMSEPDHGVRQGEKNSNTRENAPQPESIRKRASVLKLQFESLARSIKNNGFFDKKEYEGMVTDAWENITVVSASGEKTIQTLGRDDPQIKAMLDAINRLVEELEWR